MPVRMLASWWKWTKTACLSLVLVFAFAGVASALSEVWVGSGPYQYEVRRLNLDGSFISSFNTGVFVSAMTFVPEPNTFLLLSTGLIGLSARNKRRHS